MDGFDPATSFGPETAVVYDEEEVRRDEAETVAFLADLAGEDPVLELVVGTGRIGLHHERWRGWRGGPFTADSHCHVSVWWR